MVLGNKSPGRSSLPESTALKAVFSKVDWRLIPLLLIAYMVAYLDRINIGYAQLQMKQTLPFDDAVYGLGKGIFFIGYFALQVPGALLVECRGAPCGAEHRERVRLDDDGRAGASDLADDLVDPRVVGRLVEPAGGVAAAGHSHDLRYSAGPRRR